MTIMARIIVRTPQESVQVQKYLMEVFNVKHKIKPDFAYAISLNRSVVYNNGLYLNCWSHWIYENPDWAKITKYAEEKTYDSLEDFKRRYPGPWQ